MAMADSSHEFVTTDALNAQETNRVRLDWHLPNGETLGPLYEAKTTHIYDHRWGLNEASQSHNSGFTTDRKVLPTAYVETRYAVSRSRIEERINSKSWNNPWLFGWRDITNATNERTVICSVFPRTGAAHTLRVAFIDTGIDLSNSDVLVHYDIPDTRDALLWRISRFVRFGRKGSLRMVSIVEQSAKDELEQIHELSAWLRREHLIY